MNNFTKDGKYYMVRCQVCKKENYIPAVASGVCAWCVHSEALKDQLKEIVKEEK